MDSELYAQIRRTRRMFGKVARELELGTCYERFWCVLVIFKRENVMICFDIFLLTLILSGLPYTWL